MHCCKRSLSDQNERSVRMCQRFVQPRRTPSEQRHTISVFGASVMVLLLLASCSEDQVVPTDDDGCGPIANPIAESSRFTPYEGRRSSSIFESEPILHGQGSVGPETLPEEVRVVGDTLDGLQVVAAFLDPGIDASSQYFLDRPLTDQDTRESFLADGGVYLERQPSGNPGENLAHTEANELHERAVIVRLGTGDAALIWADPDRNGIRVHNLVWSDATHNYILSANRRPERIVGLGRALVCGVPDGAH